MFFKILRRIFPLSDSLDPIAADGAKRTFPVKNTEEESSSSDAGKSIQNLVENICKTVCAKSGSPSRRFRSTAEGPVSRTGQDPQSAKSHSPSRQYLSSPTLSTKTANWTIHHVKLGGGEAQSVKFESGSGVYSSNFLKDIFSELISKLLSSTTIVCRQEKRGAESELSVKEITESILKEFAKSPVKVLQLPKGGQISPAVGKTDVAKIIHASLCSILHDERSGLSVYKNLNWDCRLAERLANAIKKEILGYQIQEVSVKTLKKPDSQSFEIEEMLEKVLMEVKKINSSSPRMSTPHPVLVSQRFVHDVLTALLAKILPTGLPTTAGAKDECSEFDSIHMKLLNRVVAGLSKNRDADVQYLDKVQPNRVVSQTLANSIYNRILPEFGTTSLEKCIRTGCTILLERIYGDGLEVPEGESSLQTHLKGLSTIVIEEVTVKLLLKMFHSLPLDDLGARSIASVEQAARKIIHSLQELISKNKLKVRQHDNAEDLGSEDSQAVGKAVNSAYTDMIKHSSSETSLYEDLMNENKDLVNKFAYFMVHELSKQDFRSASDAEDELPHPNPEIKLECDRIIKKFLENIAAGKSTEEPFLTQTSVLPVSFLEEILSQFLTKILLAQCELGIHEKNSLSAKAVNEMASQLKMSVEREMSKNKVGLVASDDWLTLGPQYEDAVNCIVQSVISNVLEKSGSQQELYDDMTKGKVIFPEQVASIIINEISTFNMGSTFKQAIFLSSLLPMGEYTFAV
uniref:Fibrous sheath-interacting protein 2 C-terminal domain-containing protein n=1 Tax=Salvator merianae TaxID=96440 RepID=A0A8D0E5B8_SALMN